MAQQYQVDDGEIYEFPDDADHDTIMRYLANETGGEQAPVSPSAPEEEGAGSRMLRGLEAGGETLLALGGGATAYAGDVLNIDSLQNLGKEWAAKWKQAQAETLGPYASISLEGALQDPEAFDSFLEWASIRGPQVAVSMLPIIAGTLLAGPVGGYAAMSGIAVGDIYGEQLEATDDPNALITTAGAIPYVLLERMGLGGRVMKLLKGGGARSAGYAKRLMKELLTTPAREAVTEYGQAAISVIAHAIESGRNPLEALQDPEIQARMREEAYSGALLGTAASTVTAIPRAEQPSLAPLKTKSQEDVADPGPTLENFGSQVKEHAAKQKQGKLSADEWMSYFKKRQIPLDELNAYGVEEWLRTRPGKTTPDELTNFIENNAFDLQESWSMEVEPPIFNDPEPVDEEGYPEITEHTTTSHDGRYTISGTPEDQSWTIYDNKTNEWVRGPMEGARTFSEAQSIARVDSESQNATLWSSETTEGGTDYGEMRIWMPTRQQVPANINEAGAVWSETSETNDPDRKVHTLTSKHNASIGNIFHAKDDKFVIMSPISSAVSGQTFNTVTEAKGSLEAAYLNQYSPETVGPNYRSHAFDEPNILVWSRFKTRQGPNGERILFIEEIQSDWHQAGADHGYQSEMLSDPNVLRLRQMRRDAPAEQSRGNYHEHWRDMEEVWQQIRNDHNIQETDFYEWLTRTSGSVPDAPFKNKKHEELALKRMMAYAAQTGHTHIGITDGELQNDRNNEPRGGKGMIEAYDKRMPGFMKKYGNRNGWGTEVQRYVPITDTSDSIYHEDSDSHSRPEMHLMKITPKMRDDLLTRDQPQFAPEIQTVRATFDETRVRKMLGDKLYGYKHLHALSKEIVQNSFDSLKDQLDVDPTHQGHVMVNFRPDDRTVEIIDNGNGMLPKDVNEKFLAVGAEGKAVGRSGGLGLAKLLILDASEYIVFETVQYGVKSSFSISNAQYLDKGGFELKVEDTAEPNGTYLKLTIPEYFERSDGSTDYVYFSSSVSDEAEVFQNPLIHPTIKLYANNTYTDREATEFKKDVIEGNLDPVASMPADVKKMANLEIPGGIVEIYMGTEQHGADAYHSVFSDGVYQFTKDIRQSDGSDEFVPYTLFFNVKSDVAADHHLYPFTNQRENFLPSILEDIDGVIVPYIRSVSQSRERQNVADTFKRKMMTLHTDGTLTDTGIDQLVSTERQRELEKQAQSLNLITTNNITIQHGIIVDGNGNPVFDPNNTTQNVILADSSAYSISQDLVNADRGWFHTNLDFDILEKADKDLGNINNESAKLMHAIAYVFRELQKVVAQMPGYEHIGLGHTPVGISLDKESHGVHIMVPFQAMFVDPLGYESAFDPVMDNEKFLRYQAARITETMIHEMTHTKAWDHGEGFISHTYPPLNGHLATTNPNRANLEQMVYDTLSHYPMTFLKLRELHNDARNLTDSIEGSKTSRDPSRGDPRQLGRARREDGVGPHPQRDLLHQKGAQKGQTNQGSFGEVLLSQYIKHRRRVTADNLRDVLRETGVPYRPLNTEQENAEAASLAIIAKLIGDEVDVQFAARTVKELPVFKNMKGEGGAGAYNGMKRIIGLTFNPDATYMQPLTAYHEAIHHVQSWMFTDKEHQILLNKNNLLRKIAREFIGEKFDGSQWDNPREIQAIVGQALHVRRDWTETQLRPSPHVKKLLNRTNNFLERLVNFLKGLGYKSAADLYADINSGYLLSRDFRRDTPYLNDAAFMVDMKPSRLAQMLKGSIIINPDGLPKAMYHMTRANYPSGQMDQRKAQENDIGLHFGDFNTAVSRGNSLRDSPDSLSDRGTGYANFLHSVFLNVRNPVRILDMGRWDHVVVADKLEDMGIISPALRQELRTFAGKLERAHKATGQNYLYKDMKRDRRRLNNLLLEALKLRGYDSLVYMNAIEGPGTDSYVVFDEAQIIPIMREEHLDPGPDLRAAMTNLKKVKAFKYAHNPLESLRGVNLFNEFISSTSHLASKFPLFGQIYDLAGAKKRHRQQLAERGGKIFRDALRKLKKGEQENLQRALELADYMGRHPEATPDGGMRITHDGDEAIDEFVPGDSVTLSAKEAESYRKIREAFNYIIDEWQLSYRANAAETFELVGALNDQLDIKVHADMSIEDMRKVADALKQLVADQSDPAQVTVTDKDVLANLKSLATKMEDTTVAMESFESYRNKPYFPHVRHGDYGVMVYQEYQKKDGTTGQKLVHLETVERHGANRLFWRANVQDIKAKLRKRYPGLIVEDKRMTNEFLTDSMDKSFIPQLDTIGAMLTTSDRKAYETVRARAEDIIKKRGFSRHFSHRKNIPGHSKDMQRAFGAYLLGAANLSSHMRYDNILKNHLGAMRKAETINPELIDYSSRYVDYISSPVEEFSAWRQGMFLYHLGGNISSALIQFVSLPIFFWPFLSQFVRTGKINNPFSAGARIMGGARDVVKLFLKSNAAMFKGNLPPDPTLIYNPELIRSIVKDDQLADDFIRAWNEGHLKPLLNLESMGLDTARKAGGMGASKLSRAGDMLITLFNWAEVSARMIAFLAAHRVASKAGTMDKVNRVMAKDGRWQHMDKTPYNFAVRGIEDSLGAFGKENRPRVMRGIGAPIGQFGLYPQLMMETMTREAVRQGPEGKQALAHTVLILIAFSGVAGLPLGEDLIWALEKMWKAATGRDLNIDKELRAAVESTTGSQFAADFIAAGGFQAWGITGDARRFGLGSLPLTSSIRGLLGDNTTNDILGVPGATVLGKVKNAHEAYQATESVARASKEMAPPMLRNVVDAYLWNTEGVKNRRGENVVDQARKPILLTPRETIQKAAGFTPARVKAARDRRYAMSRLEREIQDKQASVYKRLVNIILERRRAQQANDVEKVEELRGEQQRLIDEVKRHNKKMREEEKYHLMIKIDNNSIRQLMFKHMYGEPKGTRKLARRERERVRGLY